MTQYQSCLLIFNKNVNNACWLQFHNRDMVTLKQKNPQLADEFPRVSCLYINQENNVLKLLLTQLTTNVDIKVDGYR